MKTWASVCFFYLVLMNSAFGEEICQKDQLKYPPAIQFSGVDEWCNKLKVLPECKSTEGSHLWHYTRLGSTSAKKILVLALIHGDETPAGVVAKKWMERLETIEPRNTWRIIPVVNPDGVVRGTRTNANGVDLNRNFPTQDWDQSALEGWKKTTKSDPRRYPGPTAASESEVKCLVRHIEDFKPDFVISIHTPIGVLDFDGPKAQILKSLPLPWKPLGNFSGSLGRFMWKDQGTPVLTIELQGNNGVKKLEQIDQLQDISGSLALTFGKNKKKELK